MQPDIQRLVEAALEVQQKAYAPYSDFLVGAALWTNSGNIVVGCNVENASYGLSNCAERVAIGAMVAMGEQEIVAVAVASRGGVSPCGACRQVLSEFGGNFSVHCVDSERREVAGVWTMEELLPGRFSPRDLG